MKKKAFVVEKDPNEILELEGLKVGDTVYCLRYPDNVPSLGTIVKIQRGSEKTGPYHTFLCEASGQFRNALFTQTHLEPSDHLRAAVNKELARAKKQDAVILSKQKEKERDK